MKAFKFTLKSLLIFSVLLSGCRQIFGEREQSESIVSAPTEAANIIVTSPAHGTIWNPGDTISIKWIAPTIKKLEIQLYRKSEYKFTIIENLENTGQFYWIVPLDITLSNHYLVKVANHNNHHVYKFSGRFGIQ
ncbi:MAG TPA: Ser-Thr-rich GPI-anchored membrane family protein [Ignavibacteriaceae bacterium]|nr:Ser-Thr-rich GPI-anchored membrane family protein [Ignavibacteriaceae bacterium]